jgi:hypothetical protein
LRERAARLEEQGSSSRQMDAPSLQKRALAAPTHWLCAMSAVFRGRSRRGPRLRRADHASTARGWRGARAR